MAKKSMLNTKEEFKIKYRPLHIDDMSLKTKWSLNPAVKFNLGWQIRHGTTLLKQKRWFENYKKDKTDKRFMILADNKPIGIVGLFDINYLDRNALLYIIIGEDNYRSKGIGRKACNFIFDYGFRKLKLHKIWLEVNGFNEIGIHLYKSLGFIEEGRLKDQIFYDGKYHDEIEMSLFNPNKEE